ncbi:MAG: GNAT family N-acetyltransferase [Candidatus Cardinium sp.]|uniref:GNAT family N-acetyltransferase n=1 Tax=Cardinium endosymbiont of Dermatophagoides farinae TaxID=2597823 RepID=UPI0011829C27|nr:N-acetyltransferase [Cardinium endosymbiont of Dermatophagoides farinae]TSJ81429.1 GNAT family N-acetyltransferase [Cardinium endosymbiont of Dermatophagoides farinae]UWW97491.1 MAG: GNAT family N-acetyltransferase [Candidatus Cardinium sp.]
MHIDYTFDPSTEDVNFLRHQLNQVAEGFKSVDPFGFFIKDKAKQIQAGVNGCMIYGVIYVDQLWVNKDKAKQIQAGVNGCMIYGVIYVDQLWVNVDYRNRGLGRQLMEEVHALGRKEACSMATVCTVSFLGAQNFYERLGYKVDFIRSGYANDASCVFLSKKL